MNPAKRVAGILILLVHVIGGIGAGRILVMLFFASQSELSPDPYVYNYGPRRDPIAPIWFFAVAGVLSVLIAGSLLYFLGRKFPRVSAYFMLLLLPVLYVLPFILSIAVPGTPTPDAVTGFIKDLAALTYYAVIGSLFGIALITASNVQRQPVKVSPKTDQHRKKKRVRSERWTDSVGDSDGLI
jgi:hypothetical protein